MVIYNVFGFCPEECGVLYGGTFSMKEKAEQVCLRENTKNSYDVYFSVRKCTLDEDILQETKKDILMNSNIIEQYKNKYSITCTNSRNETRIPSNNIMPFSNGYVASIHPTEEYEENFTVAVCDWDGYFDWEILKEHGANDKGLILCNDELEIIVACETIRNLPKR